MFSIQYNLSTPAEYGTDINGRISQDPEYRRSYHLPPNTRMCHRSLHSVFYYVQKILYVFVLVYVQFILKQSMKFKQFIFFLLK